MKPKDNIDIFVFALFNENKKEGSASERNFGIFNGDGSKVYDVDLSCQFCSNGGAFEKISTSGARGLSVWCVAKPHADEKVLQAVLDFSCGPGGVDCQEVYESGKCFEPDKLHAHASYAMNAYYQMHERNYWNFDFKGTRLVTFGDPKDDSVKDRTQKEQLQDSCTDDLERNDVSFSDFPRSEEMGKPTRMKRDDENLRLEV